MGRLAAVAKLGVNRLEERLQEQPPRSPSSLLPTIALIESRDTARLPSANQPVARNDDLRAQRK